MYSKRKFKKHLKFNLVLKTFYKEYLKFKQKKSGQVSGCRSAV